MAILKNILHKKSGTNTWEFAHRNGNPELLRDWLEDSGWTTALSNSEVTNSGNESLCAGYDVTKSNYVNQVTIKSQYILITSTLIITCVCVCVCVCLHPTT